MLIAWSATTPPGTAADEPDHYIVALAIGRGDIRGHPPDVDPINSLAAILKAQAPTQSREAQLRSVRWIAEGARAFSLPIGRVPVSIGCFNSLLKRADTTIPANCTIKTSGAPGERRFVSYEAVNPPYTYIFSGVAMRLAGDRDVAGAYRIGRAAMSLICLTLLGLALLLLWDREAGPLSLLGAMVATTPLSVWSFSVLNPSGMEMSAATCWAAAVLRLVRRPAPQGWWVWAAAAASGVVLATARSSGPLLVVFIPLCIGLLFGFGRLRSAARGAGRRVALVAVCLGIAMAAGLFWLRYIPSYPLGFDVFDHVGTAITGLPQTVRSAVGRFAGDYFVPVYVAVAWTALLAALVVAAAVVATPAGRRRLALFATAVIAFVVAYATLYLNNGFLAFNGRYALPGLIVLPLCAGSILVERRSQITVSARRRLVLGITVGTAAIQLLAWWLESRRLAVGTEGPLFFFSDPAWSPPGGWLPWVLTMLVGTVAYASVAFTDARRPAQT
jgi:hypothetical protein